MELKFSDRIGATTPQKVLQINEMNTTLRNSLWNYLLRTVLRCDNHTEQKNTKDNIENICELFFKMPVDDLPGGVFHMLRWLKNIYFDNNFKWYFIYNLIEFISERIDIYILNLKMELMISLRRKCLVIDLLEINLPQLLVMQKLRV